MRYESCLNHDGGLVSTVTPQLLLLIPRLRKITSPSSYNEKEHFRHLTNIYGPQDVSSHCLPEMYRQLNFLLALSLKLIGNWQHPQLPIVHSLQSRELLEP